MAHPIALPDQEPDYFSRPTASTSIQHHDTRSAEASFAESPVRDIERSMWVPKDAGLIVSQPCSPSASISSYASQNLLSPHGTTARVTSKNNFAGSRHRSRPSLLQLQALEAQRQLATLGEQNDILHQQISELQTEAESARHEGGKRLSRLNKEIRGLKAELEAATRRNDELETGGQSSRPTFPTRSTAPAAPIYSHQRTASPWSARISNRQGPAALSDARLSSTQIECSTPDHYGLPTSTSNLEAMVRSAQSASARVPSLHSCSPRSKSWRRPTQPWPKQKRTSAAEWVGPCKKTSAFVTPSIPLPRSRRRGHGISVRDELDGSTRYKRSVDDPHTRLHHSISFPPKSGLDRVLRPSEPRLVRISKSKA